jgi:uncharacterized protein YrzB (UPF0473 family)
MERELETFKVIDEKGNELVATVVTRLEIKETNKKYLIYSIDDIEDTRDVPEEEKKVFIMAARIDIDENGNEKLANLTDEVEKKVVYNAFAENYRRLVSENKE